MNKWYRACVEYNASVPEYHALLHKNVFTEDAALASIKKLKHYYNEKNFQRNSDYEIRMDRLITVIRAHETKEEKKSEPKKSAKNKTEKKNLRVVENDLFILEDKLWLKQRLLLRLFM